MNMNENIISSLDTEFIRENYLSNTPGYYFFENNVVPRVSDILSLLSNSKSLMRWSNSLGYKRQNYDDVLQLAADRGTAIHEAIENYITKGLTPDYSIYEDIISIPLKNGFDGFKHWWTHFTKDNKVEVIDIEKKLVTPYYGGTLDLLLRVNGKVYIYDFKTSNNIQYKHFIQLAAYKYAIENYYGIIIDGGVSILKIDKNKPHCKEYLLSLSIPDNVLYINYCTNLFFSLLYTYYNNLRVENNFKSVILKR